eukprot:3796068-Pyramimonas_sp.AAC.1
MSASEETKSSWRSIWLGEVATRRGKRLAIADGGGPGASAISQSTRGLWGGNFTHACVDPSSVLAAYNSVDYKTRRRLALEDPSLLFEAPFKPRASALPDDHLSVLGCIYNKKNVCRHAIGPELAASMDALCARLNRWVDGIGAAAVGSTKQLLWLRADQPDDGQPRDMAVVLVDARYGPKMQMFARVVLEHGSSMVRE